MKKNHYFLAGIHRSGNTVLSAILSQNKNMYTSPINPICEYIWQCHYAKINSQVSVTSKFHNRSDNMISGLIDSYYYDVEQDHVISTDKSWATPLNIEMIKTYITPHPKIIFTTRPVINVLASYIAVAKDNLLSSMNNSSYMQDPNLSDNDNIADFIMSGNKFFPMLLDYSLESIYNPDNAGMIHVVKYDDLIDTPQETLNGIYDFLEIERFEHDFNNIVDVHEYNELAALLPLDLHTVNKKLAKSNLNPEDYLSKEIIEKYKDVKYF